MKKKNCTCGHSRSQHARKPSHYIAAVGGSIKGGPIYCGCKQFTNTVPIEDDEIRELRREAVHKIMSNPIMSIDL